MASASISQAKIIENSGVVVMARVVGDTGAAVVQSDISAITCKVFNLEDETNVTTPTITVASAIYNSLQTPAAWTADTTGFNFSVSLAGSNFPNGDVTYRVEFKITPTSGNAYYILFDLTTINILSE